MHRATPDLKAPAVPDSLAAVAIPAPTDPVPRPRRHRAEANRSSGGERADLSVPDRTDDGPGDGRSTPAAADTGSRRLMSRKQFLTLSALVGAGLAGAGVVAGVRPRVTGQSASGGPAGGTALAPDAFGTGSADLPAGQSGIGRAAPSASVAPVTTAGRGPMSLPNLAAARAALRTPADANYVTWDPSWPADRDLEDVFATLKENDILVLPERAAPYRVDSSEGFRASGVSAVSGRNGKPHRGLAGFPGGTER